MMTCVCSCEYESDMLEHLLKALASFIDFPAPQIAFI